MAFSRSRRGGGGGHDLFWPGYVDVLSTLLMVVTFLLSIFMVAQFYISQESSGKDTVLRRLTRQIAELTNLLSLEKGQGKAMVDELSALQASLSTLKSDNERLTGLAGVGGEKDARISALAKELADKSSLSSEAQAKVDLLNQQLLQLRRQMAALQEAIGAAESKDKESQARIADLGARLNVVLAKQVQELQRYRSDFFGRLRELLRDRKDIRVVGDRFVFEFGGAVPIRPGNHDRRGAGRDRPARDRHRRAGAQHSPRNRLGAAGRRPHRHSPHRQRAVPLELGAVQRARDLGREVFDYARCPSQAPGGSGLWRVSAAGGRHHGRCAAPQSPHRAEAHEQVIQRGDDG